MVLPFLGVRCNALDHKLLVQFLYNALVLNQETYFDQCSSFSEAAVLGLKEIFKKIKMNKIAQPTHIFIAVLPILFIPSLSFRIVVHKLHFLFNITGSVKLFFI